MSKRIFLKEGENLHELIGRFVYLSYTPSRCGVIIDTWKHRSSRSAYSIFCKVEWLKTTKTFPDKITEHRLDFLKDFDELINDHRNKLIKHKSTLRELKNLKFYKRYGVWILKKSKFKCFDVIHIEKFINPPSKKDIKKLKKQYPGDIVELCPRELVEIYKKDKNWL